MNQTGYWITGLLFVGICCGILLFGDTPLSVVWHGVIARLSGETTQWNPLLDERLPRLIVLLCSGASLAVSGVVMQSLFQNPLAAPMSLGLTAGSGLCVVAVFLAGWHIAFPIFVPVAAFAGSLATLLAVYYSSRRAGRVEMSRIILTGVAFSTVLLAIQGALVFAYRDEWALMQTLTEWEAGSTVDRTWQHAHLQLPLALVGLWGCWFYRREMNLMALGDEEALNLGVEVTKVRWRLFLCVSLLIGGAIAAIGIIAFFGLVLPHLLRKVVGANHLTLVPMSMIAGSLTLSGLDLLLRVLEIRALSVGSVSAVIGGISFLLLLLESRQRQIGYS